PQLFESVLRQKHAREICLRIEIDREHGLSTISHHRCQVVHQCRLTDAALVIEKGDRLHGRLLIVANTYPGSNSNSALGLPFSASAACARITPRPKRFTYPSA